MKIGSAASLMLCAALFSQPLVAKINAQNQHTALSAEKPLKSPLVGAWKMVKFETGHNDEMKSVPYTGQLIVTSAGTLSAQAMNPENNAPDTEYTKDGYEALYGNIDINYNTGTFTVTVESSLTRNLIGKKMERSFSVNGDTLILSPVDKSEGWQVTYQHY